MLIHMNTPLGQAVIVGASVIIGGGGSVTALWVHGYFDAKKERIRKVEDAHKDLVKKLEDALTGFANAINGLRNDMAEDVRELKDRVIRSEKHTAESVAEANTRLSVLSKEVGLYQQSVVKTEGAVAHNTTIMTEYIGELKHLGGQLAALFRIVDPAGRPSDKKTR